MSDPFAALVTRTRAWFEQAHAADWLDDADLDRLAAVEQGTPADLFVDRQMRPLVVAFFGGTGVGKSSLLNRIAGETIARTGVERPTSREVTVFVHESVELADLPPELPIDTVHIKRHTSDAHRDVLWIDAPDIDSTEEANRRCALAWLPHVDLVCYVVSPERYRDDVGWRVLRERGHKHGWMFVLNRWDEGDPTQVEDFSNMLADAGFQDPLLLPTCCAPGKTLPSPDQFDQLQTLLGDLLEAHGVRELTRLGHRARLQELRRALQAAQEHLGEEARWGQLAETCRKSWQSAAETIAEGAEWSLRAVAGRFGANAGTIWEQLRRRLSAAPGTKSDQEGAEPKAADVVLLDQLTGHLWDDWTQSKLQACLDATEVSARRAGLAAVPVRRKLDAVGDSAGTRVTEFLHDHVRAAFARPGNTLTRITRRLTGFLMAFLPALALLWVAWAVVVGYYKAVHGEESFRGLDLALHSILLVLIAWAVPFTIDRLLRPSLERTALGALRAGLLAGLDDVGCELEQALAGATAEAHDYQQHSRALLTEVAGLLIKPIDARAPALARLMAQTQTAA
ncbi:MAG: GTPase domain-containing protein [Phycisphaerae bacterium]|nr:GTPase domain-containing protein [Phycisphaerae bacterium]